MYTSACTAFIKPAKIKTKPVKNKKYVTHAALTKVNPWRLQPCCEQKCTVEFTYMYDVHQCDAFPQLTYNFSNTALFIFVLNFLCYIFLSVLLVFKANANQFVLSAFSIAGPYWLLVLCVYYLSCCIHTLWYCVCAVGLWRAATLESATV